MRKNKRDNKEEKNPNRWGAEGVSTGLVVVAIVALFGLWVIFYFFSSPTLDSSSDIKKSVVIEEFILESDLGECEKEPTVHAKEACIEFVKKQCPTLKANYVLQEKKSIASQDLGYRLPALQQHNDPFYPTECIREWLLTLSEFVNLSGSPFLSHKLHTEEISSPNDGKITPDDSKTFSKFPDFKELSPGYFAHKDDSGNLQFPEKYEIEKKYSLHDQKLLKRALHAAYKYSDINVAIQDGYLAVPAYIISMGIHFMNPLLFDETVNIDEPEFLTYIKSQSNNSYALAQLGYIQIKNGEFKKFRYPLFDTPEAQGHNHLLNVSYINEREWWSYALSTNDEPSQEKMFVFVGPTGKWTTMESAKALAMYNDMKAFWTQNTTRAVISDSLWMMHVAINLYNEDGLFVDTFPLVDTMGKTGEIYSLFGKRFDLNDYMLQVKK